MGAKNPIYVNDERYQELVDLTNFCVYHAKLKDIVVSGIFIAIPVLGKNPPLIYKLERRIVAEIGDRNEEFMAVEIIARYIKYLLEHATTFQKEIVQYDEEMDQRVVIEREPILIDRERIIFPYIICKEENNVLCLGE